MLPSEYKEFGKHLMASAAFVINAVLLGEAGYFDAASEAKPLLHLWSLAIEEQFYLVWPLFLAAGWRARMPLMVVVGVVGCTSFVANVWLTGTHPSAAFYLPITRFWELLAGAALSLTVNRETRTVYSQLVNVASIAGALLIGIALSVVRRDNAFPGWWAALPVAGAVLVIAAGPQGLANRHWLSSRGMVWIGKVSYPLYLWHWPILTITRSIGSEPVSVRSRVLALLVSLVLAWLTYSFVERPIRFGSPSKWKVAAPLLLLSVLGLAGHNIYSRDGLEFRRANNAPAGMKEAAVGWYRIKECMIDADGKDTKTPTFSKTCDGRGGGPQRPLVVLWGDSYAASMYPGLREFAERRGFDLAQYTAALCPPITATIALNKAKHCDEVAELVLKRIEELKPDMVIMAGYWSVYRVPPTTRGGIYPGLGQTIAAVKRAGVSNVILMGQLPTFLDNQTSIGAKVFVKGMVDRTYKGFDPQSLEHDAYARATALSAGVGFVSPIQLLCDPTGCLISTSREALRPVAWDFGHLTEWGSQLLIERAVAANLLVLPK